MTSTGGLESHQRQCDYRYVQWIWLAGIFAGILLAGGGIGWAAARTIGEVKAETDAMLDTLVVREVREQAQQAEIDALKRRTAVLDSLGVWVPRIEQTAIETQRLVRIWRR